MAVHQIENHGTVALGLVIECIMTRRENVGTEVGVKIKNEEARGVVESVQAKVEEVEVKNGQRKREVEAENVAISGVEVKVRNTGQEVEARNEDEVAARIEVGFVVELDAVAHVEGEPPRLLHQQAQDLVVVLDVLGVALQLIYH